MNREPVAGGREIVSASRDQQLTALEFEHSVRNSYAGHEVGAEKGIDLISDGCYSNSISQCAIDQVAKIQEEGRKLCIVVRRALHGTYLCQ